MIYPVPASSVITQTFAEHLAAKEKYGWTNYNGGIDWGIPENTPVRAAMAGKVIWVGPDSQGISKGYGLHVRIECGGYILLFAHLSRVIVSVGQDVIATTIIGFSGNTGNSTGPHLHFEVRKGNVPIDPMPLLEPASIGTGVVLVPSLYLRMGPGRDFADVGGVQKGDSVIITRLQGNWARLPGDRWVCVQEGNDTYIKLTLSAATPLTPPDLSLEEKVTRLWAAHRDLWG